MYSVSLFGDGIDKDAATGPHPAKPAQGLFGAKDARTPAPLPRPEQFGRR